MNKVCIIIIIIVYINERALEDLFSSFQVFTCNQNDVYKVEGSEIFHNSKGDITE